MTVYSMLSIQIENPFSTPNLYAKQSFSVTIVTLSGKAPSSIRETEEGIVIRRRDEQDENAFCLIITTEEGNRTSSSVPQSVKESDPITVTETPLNLRGTVSTVSVPVYLVKMTPVLSILYTKSPLRRASDAHSGNMHINML